MSDQLFKTTSDAIYRITEDGFVWRNNSLLTHVKPLGFGTLYEGQEGAIGFKKLSNKPQKRLIFIGEIANSTDYWTSSPIEQSMVFFANFGFKLRMRSGNKNGALFTKYRKISRIV